LPEPLLCGTIELFLIWSDWPEYSNMTTCIKKTCMNVFKDVGYYCIHIILVT